MRENIADTILLKAVQSVLFASTIWSVAFGQHEITTQSYQADPTLISVPTPQAASVGKFGRVPVDLYNGLYSLSVPIYTVPVKSLPVDIRLSYHSGGIKPTDKGGVVGVGWSLIAGGNITRVQHGCLDEHVNTNYTDSLLGYYWNHSQLNISNWDSASSVVNFLTQIICEGSPSGCPVVTQWHDWAPDEFLFNVAGYSGSFWLDNNGNWKVRESSGEKINVSVDFGQYSYIYPTAADSVKVKYCFRKFTLTDGNGNTFIFAGDPNSIEFNRNSPSVDVWPATATSWWLTQIVTNRAEKVNFAYERLLPSVSAYGGFNAYSAQVGNNNYGFYNLQNVTGVLHDPVYLKSITYGNVAAQFNYRASNIMSYTNGLNPNAGWTYCPNPVYTLSQLDATTLPSQELNAVPPADYELDTINVTYAGTTSKQYFFAYYDSSIANRLLLKSVTIGPGTRPLVYSFAYNGTLFPSYADGILYDGLLTQKVDNWGFYNGKFPFKTSDLPQVSGGYYSSYNTYPNQDFISNYITNRAPNSDSMKIGSLASITYPTGGYTNFIYEPNDYSSQLNLANNQAVALGANNTGGGLRIKEVDSYTDPYRPPLVKRYVYKNDNGYSSGVLNTAGVLYTDSLTGTLSGGGGTFTYKFFSDNNIMPLQNSNGNSVTYSRVDEISSDSGRTINRYTNHDNGHYDLLPSNFTSTFVNARYWRQNDSRNFQRGKSIVQVMVDSSGNSVSRDSTQYLNDDSTTFKQIGVRAYDLQAREIKMMSYAASQGFLTSTFTNAYFYTPSVSPFVYYVHNYPQVQKTTSYYKGTDSIRTVEVWTYDTTNNKISLDSLKNLSDGSMTITANSYPINFPSNTFYSTMVSQHAIDPLIQQTTTNQSGKLLHVTKDSLVQNTVNSGTYYWLFEKDQYQDPTDTIRENIYKYDTAGDPIDVKGADGIPVSYLWDYSAIHPIAIAKNAKDSAMAYTSFEAEGTGNWTVPDGTRNPGGITGSLSYNITNTKTITATVPSGQTYIVSYWAQGGPAVVKANGSAISLGLTGQTKSGWTYYEYTLPNTTTSVAVTGANSSNNPIDELRLYPSTAQMSTYTYLPLTGVTSICSPSNSFSTFVWDDAMDRLLRIQDMDGNIVKQYEYHYDELAQPVWNTLLDTFFTRNNCSPGYTGTTVEVPVEPNLFVSTISQQDANNQAMAWIRSGPGQDSANAQGLCLVPIYCNNYVGVSGFTATYTSLVNHLVWNFNISSTSGVIGYLPGGRYSLTISKTGNFTIYGFSDGCSGGTVTDGTSASFALIVVSPTNCSTLTINNPQ